MSNTDPRHRYQELVEEHLRHYHNTFPYSDHDSLSLFEALGQMRAAPSLEAQARYDDGALFTQGLADFQAALFSFLESLPPNDRQRIAMAKNEVLRSLHAKFVEEYVTHVTERRLEDERQKVRGEVEA